jgi:hypothetical protein
VEIKKCSWCSNVVRYCTCSHPAVSDIIPSRSTRGEFLTMWLAELDTHSFTFLAAGDTAAEARLALRAGLSRHATAASLHEGWITSVEGDANVYEITRGTCYRDREAIT